MSTDADADAAPLAVAGVEAVSGWVSRSELRGIIWMVSNHAVARSIMF